MKEIKKEAKGECTTSSNTTDVLMNDQSSFTQRNDTLEGVSEPSHCQNNGVRWN